MVAADALVARDLLLLPFAAVDTALPAPRSLLMLYGGVCRTALELKTSLRSHKLSNTF